MFKKIALTMALVIILFGAFAIPEPVNAYLWSPTYNVKVNVSLKPRVGLAPIDAVDCKSASITVSGKTYYATVSNPWLSNSCSITFKNVYVPVNGYYNVKLNYRAYFFNYTTNFSVYLKRPVLATLTLSKTIYY